MSNSPLVTYEDYVRNMDRGRQGHRIEKIFVHHMAGNLTVKQCGNVFHNRPASAHYGINGGAVGQYVDEANTAWHCGNWNYNLRSIGIELANDSGSPKWHVADSTIETAIRLIADICRRNGIPQVIYTGDMNGNLCMHRWVCSTSCPGPYLSTKFSYIASEVNKILAADGPIPLVVDGIGGPMTVGRMQQHLGTLVDYVISGQNQSLAKYYPALEAVDFDNIESTCVKRLQWLVGVYEDGVIGPDTTKAWQKFLKNKGYNIGSFGVDGIFGEDSMAAWQKYLNDNKGKAVFPATHAPKPAPVVVTTPAKKPASNNIFDKGVDWLTAIANDNSWHYVKYNSKDSKTKECPICHNHAVGKYHGWNCIGESFAFWKHGCGIPCKCANNVINNAIGDKLLKQSASDALATLRKKIGINDIQVIRNGGKNIPQSSLKKGDICLNYKGNTYYHTFPYIGNGYTIDCGSYKDTKKQIAKRKAPSCKVAIRYVGK